MIIQILIAVAAIAGVFVAVVASRPAEFLITRNATMAVPVREPFSQVNDFHNWDAWSPWAKIDPALKQTFECPRSGPGSVYAWSGNAKAGQGRMTILESQPSERIRIQIDFLRPFVATNIAEFTFKPLGSHTVVTWSMTGRRNFALKAVSMAMNMDKLVGGDFEKGLMQMKAVVER